MEKSEIENLAVGDYIIADWREYPHYRKLYLCEVLEKEDGIENSIILTTCNFIIDGVLGGEEVNFTLEDLLASEYYLVSNFIHQELSCFRKLLKDNLNLKRDFLSNFPLYRKQLSDIKSLIDFINIYCITLCR